jgi:tetratricopeptide (TPR) repeat protein
MIVFTILLVLLIGLALLSLQLAFSGNLEGRLLRGWILLIVVVVLTIELIGTAIYRYTDPAAKFAVGTIGVILFGSQTPLFLALIVETFSFKRSKGLNLLEVHSEAERLAIDDDLPGAIREYARIVAEKPEDIDSMLRLAELLSEHGAYRKSARVYENLLAHADKLKMARHCSVLTRLAELYAHQLGDIEKARAFTRTIMNQYPDSKYARYAMDRLKNM